MLVSAAVAGGPARRVLELPRAGAFELVIPSLVLDEDPDDDRILACAVGADADVLVSGDRRHPLPVAQHEGVRIVTPQAFVAEVRGGTSSP